MSQAESEQRPHKLSYSVGVRGDDAKRVITQLEGKLKEAGVTAKLIYSGGVDLDILPQQASKGKGLEFLLRQVCRDVHACKASLLGCQTRYMVRNLVTVPRWLCCLGSTMGTLFAVI